MPKLSILNARVFPCRPTEKTDLQTCRTRVSYTNVLSCQVEEKTNSTGAQVLFKGGSYSVLAAVANVGPEPSTAGFSDFSRETGNPNFYMESLCF